MGYNLYNLYRFLKVSFKLFYNWTFFWNNEQYNFQAYEIFSAFCYYRNFTVVDYWPDIILCFIGMQSFRNNKFINLWNSNGSLHLVQFISIR